jgi:F5/8 type C domain
MDEGVSSVAPVGQETSVRSVWKPLALAAVALTALACAYTWPLLLNLRTAVLHDRGDPLLVTWILWWSSKAVPLTQRWWNAPAFFPATGVFAYSENLLSLAPFTLPVLWTSGSAIAAYNVALLLSYVLSGLSAYCLGFVLTKRHDAAFVGAIAFAFAPYRLSHTHHLQVLSSYWMPVALAALHVYARRGTRAMASLFAAAWLLQALASGYYLFFLSLLAAAWLAWFALGRFSWRQLSILFAYWALAALLLLPIIVGYRSVHARYGFKRSLVEVVAYSADVGGLVSAPHDSLLWGWLHTVASDESELFPGVTLVILIASAAAVIIAKRRRELRNAVARAWSSRSPLLFYLAAAALMWLLSLGPYPAVFGKRPPLVGPYAPLMYLPGFDEMRVPARLWMLAIVCLSAAASLIVARVPRRHRRTVAALCVFGMLADGWPGSLALADVPALRPAQPTSAVARLGLPLANNETESMYQTLGDGLPVFNGYSGYDAPQHAPLRELLERRDPGILHHLTANGPIQIVVEHPLDPDGYWRRYVEDSGATKISGAPDRTTYELPARPPAPTPLPAGPRLTVVHADASVNAKDVNAILDGDLVTRWHSPFQNGSEIVTLDLGAAHHVSSIVMCLGTYTSQYPRLLQVELSIDGQGWATVWTGRTGLAAYDAAVSNPHEVPILLSVNREARFLRLRQTADEQTRGWTIVELRVFG